MWDCKKCTRKGNQVSFIRQFYSIAEEETDDRALEEFARERPGISLEAAKHFGVVKYRGEFWIPGYGWDREKTEKVLNTIYPYRQLDPREKFKAVACPMMQHQLIGFEHLKGSDTLFICEGHWDPMAAWTMFSQIKGNGDVVFSDKVDLVGHPGSSFPEKHFDLLTDKNIYLLSHNDEAGTAGAKSLAELIAKKNIQIRSLKQLKWPNGTPSGFDIRDISQRLNVLDKGTLPQTLRINTPRDALTFIQSNSQKKIIIPANAGEIVPQKCESFQELMGAVSESLHTDPNTSTALALLLAIAISPRVPGLMLWMWLIGVPSSGKTTLAEIVSAALGFCHLQSSFNGLWSGIGSKDEKGLIDDVQKKTLIIKDFTVMLTKPQAKIDEILGQFRDIYDGSAEISYLTGKKLSFKDIIFGVIACVTHEIRKQDTAHLGARFLSFDLSTLVSNVGEVSKNNQNTDRLVDTGIDNIRSEIEHGVAPRKLIKPKCLAWGFLEHLGTRLEDPAFISDISAGFDDDFVTWLRSMAQWVAAARAPKLDDSNPSSPQVEAGTRLGKQLFKMAVCLTAVIYQRPVQTKEEVEQIKSHLLKLGWDTGHGRFQDVMAKVATEQQLSRKRIADDLGLSQTRLQKFLADLTEYGILQRTKVESSVSSTMGRPQASNALSAQYAAYAKRIGIWKKYEIINTNNNPAAKSAPVSKSGPATADPARSLAGRARRSEGQTQSSGNGQPSGSLASGRGALSISRRQPVQQEAGQH